MTDKVTLNLVSADQVVQRVDLLLEAKSYGKCVISLLAPVEGCKNEYENLDFFQALIDFRLDIEKLGLFIACYGSLKSVSPSGMSADMADGIVAYNFSLDEKKLPVRIFEPVSVDQYKNIATVAQQKKFMEEYFQRKKERWIKRNNILRD